MPSHAEAFLLMVGYMYLMNLMTFHTHDLASKIQHLNNTGSQITARFK